MVTSFAGFNDALFGNNIFGVHKKLEIGEKIFNLSAVVKPDTTNDTIRQAGVKKSFFKNTRLGVGAIENGGRTILNGAGDPVGFFIFIKMSDYANGRTDGIAGPQIFRTLKFIISNEGGGGADNIFSGAIIFIQSDDSGAGKIFFKIQKFFEVGAAKAVDGLIIITDDVQALVGASEETDKFILGRVNVLIFVN